MYAEINILGICNVKSHNVLVDERFELLPAIAKEHSPQVFVIHNKNIITISYASQLQQVRCYWRCYVRCCG